MIPNIVRHTSEHNTRPRTSKIEYIAVHYTAGTDSKAGKALDNANYYSVTDEKASADFFVDDGGIVQYNPAPEQRYCWAVGGSVADTTYGGGKYFKKAKNGNTVSVELCSRYNGDVPSQLLPNDPNYNISPEVVSRGVELVRYLMAEWDIPLDHVIRHFDVNGKLCPGVIGWNEASGDITNWKMFKKLVSKPEPAVTRYDAIYQMPSWVKPTIRKLCDKKILLGGEEKYDVNMRPADLDLSMDMIRTFIINDRAGLYD